jgi:hypothetical protein
MWNMPYDFAKTSTNGYYTDWTNATINALNLVVESETIGNTTVSLKEKLVPNADGTDTGWYQWQDYLAGTDTTAAYTDYDSTPDEARWMFIDTVYSETFVRNSMYTVTDDARQSWTTADITKTYDSITSLDFSIDFILKGLPTQVTLYYYPAGVKANAVSMGTITTDFERDGTGGDIYYGTLSVTENPDTEAAWTAAQINAGEWAIEYNETSGGGAGTFCVVRSITMYVRGEIASGSNLELDTIAVDVYGADAYSDYASGVLGRSRVWTTTKAHLQMVDDFTNSISDITNSVAVTSPPNLPLDHAQLYGQLYVVNGEDNTRIYPVDGDDDFGALTTNNADGATAITGRTVWSFGGRIFYGYVNDNTTYTPERVAYSKLNDGTTHNDDSAGDIDLIDTPGGVVKGLPLSEDLCAVYKEVGIYTLRRTGNDAVPFIRDVIDFQTSNVATMTTKRVSATNGNPVHLFLGWSPADGYSVFMFDGSTVNNVGLGISKKLREDFNHRAFRTAFAEVDPLTRHYYLFLPDENETLCTRGFSYNIRREQWREFTIPFYATCAGIWTLGGQSKALNGTQTMILGGGEGYLRKSDWRLGFDSIVNGNFNELDGSASTPDFNLYNISDAGLAGTAKEWYTSYLETGDLLLAGRDNPELQAQLNSVHMTYYTMGSSKVTVQVSTDGGQNWTTGQTYYIGDNSYTRRLRYAKFDIPPAESVLADPATAFGRRHRVRLQFDADTRWDADYEQDLPNNAFEIAEIWVGFETGGDDA